MTCVIFRPVTPLTLPFTPLALPVAPSVRAVPPYSCAEILGGRLGSAANVKLPEDDFCVPPHPSTSADRAFH